MCEVLRKSVMELQSISSLYVCTSALALQLWKHCTEMGGMLLPSMC